MWRSESIVSFAFDVAIGQVILVDNGNWVMFSNGFFSGQSRSLDFTLLLIATTSFIINSLCLPLQYFYRYLAVAGFVGRFG